MPWSGASSYRSNIQLKLELELEWSWDLFLRHLRHYSGIDWLRLELPLTVGLMIHLQETYDVNLRTKQGNTHMTLQSEVHAGNVSAFIDL